MYSLSVMAFIVIIPGFYEVLLAWLNASNRIIYSETVRLILCNLQHACSAHDNMLAIDIVSELMEEHVPKVADTINEFRTAGRQQSVTFAFWADFLADAQVLLHLLRVEIEGALDLHLSAMNEALPWFRAAGRHNNVKYVPTYVANISALNRIFPSHTSICVKVVW
jgi:hypothetical protein